MIGRIETITSRALWLGGASRRARRALRPRTATARAHTVDRGTTHLGAGSRPDPDASRCGGCRGCADRTVSDSSYGRRPGGDHACATSSGEAAKNEGRHHASLQHFRDLRPLLGTSYLAEEIVSLQLLDRYEHAQILLDQARRDTESAIETGLPALAYAQVWQDFNLGRLDDADAGARGLIELGQQLGTNVHVSRR